MTARDTRRLGLAKSHSTTPELDAGAARSASPSPSAHAHWAAVAALLASAMLLSCLPMPVAPCCIMTATYIPPYLCYSFVLFHISQTGKL